jgi:hypothetical protein
LHPSPVRAPTVSFNNSCLHTAPVDHQWPMQELPDSCSILSRSQEAQAAWWDQTWDHDTTKLKGRTLIKFYFHVKN